jgi:hypothetical protein
LAKLTRSGTGPPPCLFAAAALALLATLFAAWLSRRAFEGIPHVSDGVAYAFQGRVFASGRLWLAPPPVPQAFGIGNVVLSENRWAGKYPPGFPLLLSVGYLLNVPWLVDPVLLGLAVFGVFRLGRTLYDAPTGLLAAFLLAISPFALVLGATFLSHVPALCVAIWTLEALARGRKTDDARPLLLAGFLAGVAVAIRPYTAAALLFPAGVWLVWRAAPRVVLRRAALVLAGAALPLLLHAGFNAAVWGNPLQTGYTFGSFTERLTGTPGRYIPPFVLFLDHFPRYLVDLNRDPWAEPWPDLLPLVFLFPRRKRRGEDSMLLACALSLVVAYSVYWHYDPLHSGPRYAAEALGPLALLVARGLFAGEEFLRERLSALRVPQGARVLLVAALAGLLVWFPLGRRLPRLVEANSRAYGGQTLEPLSWPGAEKVGPDALVLVSGPWLGPSYAAFALLNDIDPRKGRRVYAIDVPERRNELLAAFPREQVWEVFVGIAPWHSKDRFAVTAFEVRRVVWNRIR